MEFGSVELVVPAYWIIAKFSTFPTSRLISLRVRFSVAHHCFFSAFTHVSRTMTHDSIIGVIITVYSEGSQHLISLSAPPTSEITRYLLFTWNLLSSSPGHTLIPNTGWSNTSLLLNQWFITTTVRIHEINTGGRYAHTSPLQTRWLKADSGFLTGFPRPIPPWSTHIPVWWVLTV